MIKSIPHQAQVYDTKPRVKPDDGHETAQFRWTAKLVAAGRGTCGGF